MGGIGLVATVGTIASAWEAVDGPLSGLGLAPLVVCSPGRIQMRKNS